VRKVQGATPTLFFFLSFFGRDFAGGFPLGSNQPFCVAVKRTRRIITPANGQNVAEAHGLLGGSRSFGLAPFATIPALSKTQPCFPPPLEVKAGGFPVSPTAK